MDWHCWAGLGSLATTIGVLGAYIARVWRLHAREVKTLNDEYKGLLLKLLEDVRESNE